MNSKSEIEEPEVFEPEDSIEEINEIDADSSPSVDDFIKELEAKEKDLHITADLEIEIEDSEFETSNTLEIVDTEPTVTNNSGEPIVRPTTSVSPPTAASPGMKTRVFELEKEVESLTNKLTALRMERNDVQEKSDRRLKDFESYKYRMDRERRGSVIAQVGNIVTQLLPVLDNLDRALDSVSSLSGKQPEFQQFFDGIGLVNQQIKEILTGMGVQPIDTVGQTFDPHFHEAVATDENSDLPPNTISGEMLRGYRIGNLVIRHSMVRVTAGPASSKNAAKQSDETPIEESAPIDTFSQSMDATNDEQPSDAEEA